MRVVHYAQEPNRRTVEYAEVEVAVSSVLECPADVHLVSAMRRQKDYERRPTGVALIEFLARRRAPAGAEAPELRRKPAPSEAPRQSPSWKRVRD